MTSKTEVIAKFKTKYDYLSAKEIDTIYDVAMTTYLDLAFPFEQTITEVPASRPRAYTWIYDCMAEILERSGCSSMSSYSENGLSITWDNTGISKGLLTRVTPKVGVVG